LRICLSGVIYAGLACGTIDPLIGGLTNHATSQLQVLKENLCHLDSEVDEELASSCDEIVSIKPKIIHHKIKLYVRRYQEIIEYITLQ
jgi:hypothetical protein